MRDLGFLGAWRCRHCCVYPFSPPSTGFDWQEVECDKGKDRLDDWVTDKCLGFPFGGKIIGNKIIMRSQVLGWFADWGIAKRGRVTEVTFDYPAFVSVRVLLLVWDIYLICLDGRLYGW